MNRAKIAEDFFMNKGFKCSQAVFEVFRDRYDISYDTAMKLSSAFAGGSGEGGACGAVAAAFMVISMECGTSDLEKSEVFRDVLGLIEEFSRIFRDRNDTIKCVELTGVEVFTDEGFEKFVESKTKEKKCSSFVKESVEILEEILSLK
ncbi:MAG: C_GCAxxG_C_C family protein [Desulfobacterales bacterium]|nr:C_GCAxxG_C_C family protein [Desulfobacterales bacterium]MCP4159545.1 C_GCAxxG_C_C family protein [Deltaproteobacteria bacterium]